MATTSRRAADGAGSLQVYGSRLLTGLLKAITRALAAPVVASRGHDWATGLLGNQMAARAGGNVANATSVGAWAVCGTAAMSCSARPRPRSGQRSHWGRRR
jgi:hypothetical protein